MSAYLFTHGSGGQYWIGLPTSLPPGGLPMSFADEHATLEFLRGVGYESRTYLHALNALLRFSASGDPGPAIARQVAQGTLGVSQAVVSAAHRGEAPARRWFPKPRWPR